MRLHNVASLNLWIPKQMVALEFYTADDDADSVMTGLFDLHILSSYKKLINPKLETSYVTLNFRRVISVICKPCDVIKLGQR